MKRHHKSADGLYHIKGKTYKKLEGSRREVGYGTAYKTSGGLTLNDLVFRNGRWKSAKKHKTAKKNSAYKNMDISHKKENLDMLNVLLKEVNQNLHVVHDLFLS